MKSNYVILLLVLMPWMRSNGQNQEFQQFAKSKDSLMMQAYYSKNVQAYLPVLKEVEDRFSALTIQEKKNFSGYIINAYYNLCCTYSLINDKKNALAFLKKAIDAGYTGYAHMQKDSDLDNIRKEPSFANMVHPLRKLGDYLYILKKAGQYNTEQKQELPKFTYQDAGDPRLVALRKELKLDSIAGTASEISKILNLMHWIHNLIPHDGNNGNPDVKNALSMIRECAAGRRGLNCRGLAIVLNECFLSMGIQSRYVTCLPKDSLGTDPDCHVINMVYSAQLKKWIWIDPTFDAYVMNEKGELLGIEEVRQRLINDQPLILNPEANWNRRTTQTPDEYLYNYMAKNLYMLECPVSSEFDLETKGSGKTVQFIKLIPLDYFNKSLDKYIRGNSSTGTWITHKTNNPATFWQKPE